MGQAMGQATGQATPDAGVEATDHLISPLRERARSKRLETADQLKKALRESDLSEDEEHRELENLQKLTDRYSRPWWRRIPSTNS